MRAFAAIAFTPGVKAAQERHGSRQANAAFERGEDAGSELTAREMEFIEARDSFYQATVSETGWPYVQHRGGPPGFLKVLDPRTIGYADFYGNAQYLSVGNLAGDDRISIILMSYPDRRRLKLWGRARIVEEENESELVARLEVPDYRARVMRGVLIHIEAWDWNCPQHITPRFTQAEVEQLVTQRIRERTHQAQAETFGAGELELTIVGVRQLTPHIRAYELQPPDGKPLPVVSPGAYLRVPVHTRDGGAAQRQYSIARFSPENNSYEIAVRRHERGGGSQFVHDRFTVGTRVRVAAPGNHFHLHQDSRPAVLLGAGIGITPLMCMASELKRRGAEYHIHYAAKTSAEMAYRGDLQREHTARLTTYFSDAAQRMSFERVFTSAPADAVFYACGPARFLDDLRRTAETVGVDPARIRIERFAASDTANDKPLRVHLRRSNKTVDVSAKTSVLAAVRQAGVEAQFDCAVGTCGTCAVRVLDGVPEHRDHVLTASERDRHQLMCICVSRAISDSLVLDL